jgi:hypothetical protein
MKFKYRKLDPEFVRFNSNWDDLGIFDNATQTVVKEAKPLSFERLETPLEEPAIVPKRSTKKVTFERTIERNNEVVKESKPLSFERVNKESGNKPLNWTRK